MAYVYMLGLVGVYSSQYNTLEECKKARQEYINYVLLEDGILLNCEIKEVEE